MTVDAPPTLPFRLANLNGTRNIQMTGGAGTTGGGGYIERKSAMNPPTMDAHIAPSEPMIR